MLRIECLLKVNEMGVQSCVPFVDLVQYVPKVKIWSMVLLFPRKPACSFLKMTVDNAPLNPTYQHSAKGLADDF